MRSYGCQPGRNKFTIRKSRTACLRGQIEVILLFECKKNAIMHPFQSNKVMLFVL